MLTDGRTDDGRTTDAGVIGILIAHLGAFGSGELKKRRLSIFMAQKDQKGSMITDTFVGHCVHARVVVYMYLIFVMTGQNISTICISPNFIEPSIYH